jgi:hypothetical protein
MSVIITFTREPKIWFPQSTLWYNYLHGKNYKKAWVWTSIWFQKSWKGFIFAIRPNCVPNFLPSLRWNCLTGYHPARILTPPIHKMMQLLELSLCLITQKTHKINGLGQIYNKSTHFAKAVSHDLCITWPVRCYWSANRVASILPALTCHVFPVPKRKNGIVLGTLMGD